jgi:hypothetical protein
LELSGSIIADGAFEEFADVVLKVSVHHKEASVGYMFVGSANLYIVSTANLRVEKKFTKGGMEEPDHVVHTGAFQYASQVIDNVHCIRDTKQAINRVWRKRLICRHNHFQDLHICFNAFFFVILPDSLFEGNVIYRIHLTQLLRKNSFHESVFVATKIVE